MSRPAKGKGEKKEPAFFYEETPEHGLKVVARLKESQAKNLRRIARRLGCVVLDASAAYPVPSSRALVQAIADGRLTVSKCRAAASDTLPPTPAGKSKPKFGGCPKD